MTEDQLTQGRTSLADAPDVLSVEEVAKIARLGRNTAYELVKTGQIRSVRVGRKILVPKTALIRWLEA